MTGTGRAFVETWGESCLKTGWQVHPYVLRPHHFHLVVGTPQPNLVAGMKWFLGTDTARFNRRHKVCGHLFSGRYKSLVVDGSGNGYLKTVCARLVPSRARQKNCRSRCTCATSTASPSGNCSSMNETTGERASKLALRP